MDAKTRMKRKTVIINVRYHIIIFLADDITDDEIKWMKIVAEATIDGLRENLPGYADGEPWRLFREGQAKSLGIDPAAAGDGKPDFIEPDLE